MVMASFLQRLQVLLVLNGIAAVLAFHAVYLATYFNVGEWWRCNVPWSIEDLWSVFELSH